MTPFPGQIQKHGCKKMTITPEQEAWFRVEFPRNTNGELATAMGLHPYTVRILARQVGLEKSKEWLSAFRSKTAIVVCARLRARGVYDSPEWKAAVGHPDRYWLQKWRASLTPEQKEKLHQSYLAYGARLREKIQRDRKRVALGLKPLTKLFSEQPYNLRQTHARYSARKHNYIVPLGAKGDERYNIYYDSETNRSQRVEANLRKHGFRIIEDK